MKEKEIKNNTLFDIPLPPTPKNEKEIINFDSGFKKTNTFLRYYFTPLFILFCNIAGLVSLFVFKQQLGYFFIIALIFYVGICMPLLLGIFGFMILRLIVFDKHKLSNKIIPMVSRNFIVVNLLLTQKRIKRIICLLNKDGISFYIGKLLYIIDKDKIFFDEDNFPNGFWFPNLPNQLGLDYDDDRINNYFKKISEGDIPRDKKNNVIDIIYSSENLEKFRKDKVFWEFHEKVTPETLKMVYILLGVVALCVVAIIIIVIVTKS